MKGSGSRVLLACCIGFFWAQSSRAVLYAAMPAVSAETGLGPADVGLVTGAIYAGYSVAVYLSGFIPLGRRATVAGGFVLAALGNVAFAQTGTRTAMLVVALVSGAGVGLYLPRGATAIVEAFDRKRLGRAMGWHEVAATGGLMLAPLAMGAMLLIAPWRLTVALWSLVGLIAAAAVWRLVPDAPPPSLGGRARLALDLRAPALACAGGACFAMMAGFFTMLPTIAVQGWGLTPSAGASLAGWMRASGLLGSLAGGWVTDRVGRVRALVGCYVIALGAIAGLVVLDYGFLFGVLVVVMTNAGCAGATAYYALMGDAYDRDERERTFSLIAATASIIGSVVTPIALGAVLSAFDARTTVALMVVAPLLGLGGAAIYARVAARRAVVLAA